MIKVFEPKLSFFDKYEILKAVQKNNISGTSPIINEFENLLSKTFERQYSVAVSNGSVALEVAIKSLDLPKGSEVIVPSFTIISCLSAIIRSGLKPVFADVDKDSWNITLKNVLDVYTKNTKAILIVHTYGLPCEVNNISRFCDENKLILIEDSAEGHGIKIEGKPCGSFGECSILSFYANKHITTGEGGAVLTDSYEQYKKIKRMINLDFVEPNRYNHENFYWNYRMGGLQAALGISQIKKFKDFIEFKKKQGKYYSELLNNSNEKIQIPLTSVAGVDNNYWVYGIVLKNNISRDKIRRYLFDSKIETRDFFWPLHLQKAYLKTNNISKSLPISELLGRQGFYIPIGKHINKKNQSYIAEKIIESLTKFGN